MVKLFNQKKEILGILKNNFEKPLQIPQDVFWKQLLLELFLASLQIFNEFFFRNSKTENFI